MAMDLISLRDRLNCAARKIEVCLEGASLEVWQRCLEEASAVHKDAIELSDAEAANEAWFIRQTAEQYWRFILCVETMRAGDFYEAWCDLERVEIGLAALIRNPFLEPKAFNIPSLAALVSEWQSLYPYHVFISPELLAKRVVCGICGKRVSPWSDCTHQAGDVYAGIECVHIVEELEFLSVALVLDPVQKYSVLFMQDAEGQRLDHYDYSIVRYVAETIPSPLTRWRAHQTQLRHSHELFNDRPLDGPCPCESEHTYSKCCAMRPGVLRPHIAIEVSGDVEVDWAEIVFAGYGKNNGSGRLVPSGS